MIRVAIAFFALLAAQERPITTVGLEGRISRAIAPPKVEVLPLTEDLPVSLWIEAAHEERDVLRYEFGYVGLESGTYDLSTYLRRIDGSDGPIPPIVVECVSVLPASYDGSLIFELRAVGETAAPGRPGRVVLLGIWLGTTALVVVALVRRRRKKRPPRADERELLEKIRPLARLALAGSVSEEGRARLDRMLMRFWQERLDLGELSPDEALPHLLTDPSIGASLREFQAWVHGRSTATPEVVEVLLEPFADDGIREGLEWSSNTR